MEKMTENKKYIVINALYATDEIARHRFEEQEKDDLNFKDLDFYLSKSLETCVNKKIEDGYIPIGGIEISGKYVWNFFQAMIKDD